jgi:phosphohistidine phosphatase
MARELWLLRHAEAEPHGSREDAERRLTDRGEEQARWAGSAIRSLGVEFESVWSSPKVRARATAEIAVGADLVQERDVLRSGFDGRDALDLAHELSAEGRGLMVGHNPDFEQAVADLTGARVDMKKGGIAVVGLDGGELLALLRPRDLRRIAGLGD